MLLGWIGDDFTESLDLANASANHRPVVVGKELDAAFYAIEELEKTAKLVMLTRGLPADSLNET